jgi:hypothetical protein
LNNQNKKQEFNSSNDESGGQCNELKQTQTTTTPTTTNPLIRINNIDNFETAFSSDENQTVLPKSFLRLIIYLNSSADSNNNKNQMRSEIVQIKKGSRLK